MKLVFKGQLGDGHVHMQIRELLERVVESRNYQQKKTLTKLANNQIFSLEVRQALWMAIHDIDHRTYWRNIYMEHIKGYKPLRADNRQTTKPYVRVNEYACETCGSYLDPAYLYCPGCGKEIIWQKEGRKGTDGQR